MKTKRGLACLLLTALAVLAAVLPLDALSRLGLWLRELSLSGGPGNAKAWAAVVLLTALPALGLLWRGRSRWDWLLPLASLEIFGGLYFLVNPTLLHPLAWEEIGILWSLAVAGGVTSTLLGWAVLRGLSRLGSAGGSLGQTLEELLRWAAVLLGWLAAWSQGADLLDKIRALQAGNTAPGLDLTPTICVLCLLAAANLLPALLGSAALYWGGALAQALESSPFSQDTVTLAETLSRRCGQIAAASVLACAGGNLLQMLLFPLLYSVRIQVSFPFATVLLAAVLRLLCRYFRRAKAVSDDNETII